MNHASPSAPGVAPAANRRDKLQALRDLIMSRLGDKPHTRALLFARAIEAGFTDRAGLITGALALLEDDGLIREQDGVWSLIQR